MEVKLAEIAANPMSQDSQNSLKKFFETAFLIYTIYQFISVFFKNDTNTRSDQIKILIAASIGGIVGGSFGKENDRLGGLIAGGIVGTFIAIYRRRFPPLNRKQQRLEMIRKSINSHLGSSRPVVFDGFCVFRSIATSSSKNQAISARARSQHKNPSHALKKQSALA
jgi:hypothetical protein